MYLLVIIASITNQSFISQLPLMMEGWLIKGAREY